MIMHIGPICAPTKWLVRYTMTKYDHFLLHDADMHSAYLLRQHGWLAGWISITRRYGIRTAKPILKLFRPSGSPIILVSSDPCADTQFRGSSPVALNTHGGKNGDFRAIFDGNRRLSRKRCEIGRWLLRNVNKCQIEWYNFRWPWVTPNPGFKVTAFLKSNIVKTARLKDKVTIAQ